MTENVKEEPQELSCIKQKFVSCFKGVRLLKTLIIIVCIVIVTQQIITCINKLIVVPITTYTHFDFNRTLMYPSVTFCKEPAYKYDKLDFRHCTDSVGDILLVDKTHLLSTPLQWKRTLIVQEHDLYLHPRWSSMWTRFNFSTNLDDLWEEITYDEEDVFVQYGLDGLPENVEINETVGFYYGRCYTVTPKVLCTHASKPAGYSFTLRHYQKDVANLLENPPGYHVFIHYTEEPFTEVEVYNGGLVQNIFVNVGETIDVKLTVDEYGMISDDDTPCTNEPGYSTNNCTAQHVWDTVGEEVGCSGPWMRIDLPHCSNYTTMRQLIGAYMREYKEHETTTCPRHCKTYMYNAYVMQRNDLYVWDGQRGQWFTSTRGSNLETQIFIYFNSMMVSVYKEQYNYDWNLFISDLGGSVGFLLGLSVIGLLKIAGKTYKEFIKPCLKSRKKTSSITSTSTTDVAEKYQKQDKEWQPSVL